MTGRYQPYSEYKNSQQEWLGDIPHLWKVKYSKWLFGERNKKATPKDEMLTASQKYGVIPQKMFMELEQQKVVQVQTGQEILKSVKKNDFVISMRSFQGGIEFCNYNGAVSSAYVPLIPSKEVNIDYYKYLFKCKPYIQALQSTTNLVRDGQALRYTNFLQVKLPSPPTEEAQKIVNFLNVQTLKIDSLISKQLKIIDLLKEKRLSLIDEIISDKNTVKNRLSALVEIPHRPCERNLETYYTPLGLLNRGRGIFCKDKQKGGELGDSDFYYVKKGDLILSGQFAWEGAIALAGQKEENAIVSHRFPILRGVEGVLNTNYLWAFLTTDIGNFILNECSVGAAGRNRPLNLRTLLKEKIPVPSLQKQLEISEFIEAEKSLFNSISNQITLLKEKRESLISSVVLGRVNIQNFKESSGE